MTHKSAYILRYNGVYFEFELTFMQINEIGLHFPNLLLAYLKLNTTGYLTEMFEGDFRNYILNTFILK